MTTHLLPAAIPACRPAPTAGSGVDVTGLSLSALRAHRDRLRAVEQRVLACRDLISCAVAVLTVSVAAGRAPDGSSAPVDVAGRLRRLHTADAALARHQQHVHGLLEAATAELVDRYRRNPAAVLSGR